MAKFTQNFLKELGSELRKEVAEDYYINKVYLEEEWKVYEEILEDVEKEFKKFLLSLFKFYIIGKQLKSEEKLEKLLGLSFKDFEKFFPEKDSLEIFSQESLPFALTFKGKIKKFLLNLYKELFSNYLAYKERFKQAEKWYKKLIKETERFYRNHDLSYILRFFNGIEEENLAIQEVTNKEEIFEKLKEKLKLSLPPPPEEKFVKMPELESPENIKPYLITFVEKLFTYHPDETKRCFKSIFRKV